MTTAGPDDDARRSRILRDTQALDLPQEPAFDDLALLASQVCETPMALLSVLGEKRPWFRGAPGTDTPETRRAAGFYAQAVQEAKASLEIPDTREDTRFKDRPLDTSAPQLRFCAGAPLIAPDGSILGALCVMDQKPRTLRADQLCALKALSRNVVGQLELRRHARELREESAKREQAEEHLREQNEKLARSREETARLLELAEKSRRAALSILEDEQRSGQELARTNRALKMLSGCNEALIAANDEPSLLKQVCQIAVDLGERRMAMVGYAQDDEAKSIVPMAHWGADASYLADLGLSWAADAPAGQGPAGRCVREGKAVICKDIRDPAEAFFSLVDATSRGFRSVICLPLRGGGRTFGLLGLYSDEIRDVSATEVGLLQELADDLAFGIGTLRSRVIRERAEEALVASLREKEALLKEVHHRVKNNLQVIASLLRLEERRLDHAITKSVLREMQGRIQSMALLHETLYRSGNFARVDLAAYLGQLANQLVRSLAATSGVIRLNLDLTPVSLDIDQAIPCGLIVNELASNCLKHAFPDGRSGELTIRLKPSADGGSQILTVSDNGSGLPPDFDVAKLRSLGLQLVSDLARQLQGSLAIGAGPGAVFEVTFVRARTGTTGPTQVDRASLRTPREMSEREGA